MVVVMALACCCPQHTVAFSVQPKARSTSLSSTSTSQLGMFGGLKGAFANDESLDKPQNAGLKNGPQVNENVTVNGKAVPGAVVGQKLTTVAGRVRVKIPVNCQKGDCGTCMVKVNGRKLKGEWSVLSDDK